MLSVRTKCDIFVVCRPGAPVGALPHSFQELVEPDVTGTIEPVALRSAMPSAVAQSRPAFDWTCVRKFEALKGVW